MTTNALITDLRALALPFHYRPSGARILAACDAGDWSGVVASVNAAQSDSTLKPGHLLRRDLTAWGKRAGALRVAA
jgi:hypothetical protein